MSANLSKEQKNKLTNIEGHLILWICTLVGLLGGYILSLPVGIALISFGFDGVINYPAYFFTALCFIGAVIGYKYGKIVSYRWIKKELIV
jgi:hypothetical protein